MNDFRRYIEFLKSVGQEYKLSHNKIVMNLSDGVCEKYGLAHGIKRSTHYVHVWCVDRQGWPEIAHTFSSKGKYKGYSDMSYKEHTNGAFIKDHKRLEDVSCICSRLLQGDSA